MKYEYFLSKVKPLLLIIILRPAKNFVDFKWSFAGLQDSALIKIA